MLAHPTPEDAAWLRTRSPRVTQRSRRSITHPGGLRRCHGGVQRAAGDWAIRGSVRAGGSGMVRASGWLGRGMSWMST